MLSWRDDGERSRPADERMTLVFIELPDPIEPTSPTSSPPVRAARPAQVSVVAPVAPPASEESATIAPGIDWHAQGSQAAARATAAPTTRNFDFPKHEPAPREKKPFGWDKTHTERVSSIPGGGILLRLSDNCAIGLAPLPFGGCALGKRKARGDLFDEMQAPPQMGDWKDK